jgi:hypothetical protein
MSEAQEEDLLECLSNLDYMSLLGCEDCALASKHGLDCLFYHMTYEGARQ